MRSKFEYLESAAPAPSVAHEGVADRPRPDLDQRVGWLLAVDRTQVDGFTLETGSRST